MTGFSPIGVTLLFITVVLGASWRSAGGSRRRPSSRGRPREDEQRVVWRGKKNQRTYTTPQRRDEEGVDRDASSSTASGRPSDDASEPMAGPSTSSGSSGRQEHGTSSGETTASARDAQNVATFAKPSRTTRPYSSEIVEEGTDDAESCDGTPPMRSVSPPSRAASPSIERDDPSRLRRDLAGVLKGWCCSFFSCFSTAADDDASSVDEVGDFHVHVTEAYHAGKKRKRVTKIGDYCDDPDAHDACKKLRKCSRCRYKKLCESFFDGKKKKFFKTCSDCRPKKMNTDIAARAADLSLCQKIDPHDDCDMERICNRCQHSLPCENFFNPDKGKFFGGCRDCRASHEERRKNIRAAAEEVARSNPACRGFTLLDCDGIAAVAASALTRLKAKFAAGSKSYVYAFQWSSGWNASAEDLYAAERKESISHLSRMNGVLQHHNPENGEYRRAKLNDVFFGNSKTILHRVAISPVIIDITEIERTLHVLTEEDAVGFRGNLKNGGSPTRQKRNMIYGVSILEIPDPGALNLRVREDNRERYENEVRLYDGRARGLSFPDVQVGLELPPTDGDEGTCFVLGGAQFEQHRGLLVDESRLNAFTTIQQQSEGNIDEDRRRRDAAARIVDWDGAWPPYVHFSGVRANTILDKEQQRLLKENRTIPVNNRLTSWISPMTLLVVDFEKKDWDLTKKVEHALDKHIPIISKQMFISELMPLTDTDEMEE